MMINFETENLIIVCYPQNAGCKFLINCLGLSTDAVFQDKNLASLQLTGNYNTDNKIDYIRNKMIQTQTSWSDLDLGCQQLFGINNETYLTKIPESYLFANVISNLSHGDYKFFLVAHSEEYLKQYIARWPNAKLIIFEILGPSIFKSVALSTGITNLDNSINIFTRCKGSNESKSL